MHLRFTSFATAVPLIILPAISLGADYVVSPDGADSAAGSAAAPWLTLQHAADTVSAGDTVLVRPGTYVGFQLTTAGTDSARIVFRADGAGVLVNAQNASTPDNINLEGSDYITIEGFEVEDAPRIGIRTVLSRGVVIRNNTVRDSGLTGILSGFAVDLQILGNSTSGAVDEHGIYVSNSDEPNDNVLVRGNESFSNGTNGIQFNGDCDDSAGIIDHSVIEQNYVHDNHVKGLSLISLQDSVIQNNIMVDNGIDAGAGGIHLTDEIGCGMPSNNNIVANNTIHETRITGIRINDGSTGNRVFNNIVISGRGGDYILVDEVGTNDIDGASNIIRDSGAGLFLDLAGGDLLLAEGSDAIDVGVASYSGADAPSTDFADVGRPQGTAFDVGAHEYCEGGCEPVTPDAGTDGGSGGTGGGTTGPDGGMTTPGNGAEPEDDSGCGCRSAGATGPAAVALTLLPIIALLRLRRRRDRRKRESR